MITTHITLYSQQDPTPARVFTRSYLDRLLCAQKTGHRWGRTGSLSFQSPSLLPSPHTILPPSRFYHHGSAASSMGCAEYRCTDVAQIFIRSLLTDVGA